MGETLIRWPAYAAALAAVLAVGACSRSAPPEAALPAQPVASQSAEPPLAGGPSAQDQLATTSVVAPARPVDEAPAPPLQRVSYGHFVRHHDHEFHEQVAQDRRARELEIERRDYFAYRRYLAEERLRRERLGHVRHWYYRDHHLVFEHPAHGRPLHRYGFAAHRYAAPYHRHASWRAAPLHAAPNHIAHGVHPVVGQVVTKPAAKPVAKPAPAPAARPAPHPAALVHPRSTRIEVKPASQPVALQQSGPRALATTTLALPLISPQPAPAITPDQAAAAPAVDLATQLGQLTTAVAEVMKGARLEVPPAISTGGEAKVVLTLPPDLLDSARAKAAQVGLGSSARKLLVTAKLAGQGYAITPDAEQTARLESGEPTVFSWDVKPSSTPGGVLTADMTGSLQGDGDDKTFALGAVTAQIPVGGQTPAAPAPIQAPASTGMHLNLKLPDLGHVKLGAVRLPDLSGLHLRDLAIPGHPTVGVPGLGQVASYKVVAVAILALLVILLISISRSATARRERAERRRRFHSFEANQLSDEHP